MAGSIDYRTYTSDSGIAYSVRVDKSNASATVSGGAGELLPARTANNPPLPKGLKMRYALAYSVNNPRIKRKFYIGTAANITAALAVGSVITAPDYPGSNGGPGTSVQFTITAYRGEQNSKIPAFNADDTGLTDGSGAAPAP